MVVEGGCGQLIVQVVVVLVLHVVAVPRHRHAVDYSHVLLVGLPAVLAMLGVVLLRTLLLHSDEFVRL